jgi:hypothetical protein
MSETKALENDFWCGKCGHKLDLHISGKCAGIDSCNQTCNCQAAAELSELHNCIDKLEGELAAEVSKNIKLRSELDDVREAIEYIGQRSNFQIPSYAYSDNEAATYMASYLNEIDQIASAFLKAHPEVTK